MTMMIFPVLEPGSVLAVPSEAFFWSAEVDPVEPPLAAVPVGDGLRNSAVSDAVFPPGGSSRNEQSHEPR